MEILHTLNGPEGTPAAQTRNSVDIILSGLKRLKYSIKSAEESLQDNFELSTITTLHNEHFNSKMRQKQKETPMALDLAINFSDSVEESIKERTDSGYPIFTGERWHYQVPDKSHIKFTKLKLPPSLPSRKLSQADKEALAHY